MSNDAVSILSQIRSYEGQLRDVSVSAEQGFSKATLLNELQGLQSPQATPPTSGFSDALKNAFNAVNNTQVEAGELAKNFELGDPSADLAKVMMASQQSQIAFRATVEVRNRLVQAYQDVMNMPL